MGPHDSQLFTREGSRWLRVHVERQLFALSPLSCRVKGCLSAEKVTSFPLVHGAAVLELEVVYSLAHRQPGTIQPYLQNGATTAKREPEIVGATYRRTTSSSAICGTTAQAFFCLIITSQTNHDTPSEHRINEYYI